MALLLILIWVLIGGVAYWYFWTKEFDLTTNDLQLLFCYSLFGPFAWIILYFIYYPIKIKERTIFRQRKHTHK